MNDISNPSLKTHHLKGRHQSCLTFRIKDGFRVLFEITKEKEINLLDVGHHDIYKKRK